MFKPVCNLVGYQCQLARNRSAPNQWAQSAINVCMDTSNKCINAKSMGTISYQCPQGHTYKIGRCQTNCHTQLLMSTHTHTQARHYQWQTNGHDPQPVYKNREQLLSCSNQ